MLPSRIGSNKWGVEEVKNNQFNAFRGHYFHFFDPFSNYRSIRQPNHNHTTTPTALRVQKPPCPLFRGTALPCVNIDNAHTPPKKPLRNHLRAHSGSSILVLTTLSFAPFFRKKCNIPLPRTFYYHPTLLSTFVHPDFKASKLHALRNLSSFSSINPAHSLPQGMPLPQLLFPAILFLSCLSPLTSLPPQTIRPRMIKPPSQRSISILPFLIVPVVY